MKNAFVKVLSFAIAATVGLSASAATIVVDNIPDFLDAVSKDYADIVLKPGVYDFTGVPVSGPNTETDKRTAYVLVRSGITIRGENTKHWSEKTREEETVIKGDGATRLVYGYGGGGRGAKFFHITFEDGNAWNSPDAPNRTDGKYGGAIYYMGNSSGYATNCVFRNCSAKYGGGTYCVSSYDCLYENCTAGDETSGYGGGAYGSGSADYKSVTNRYASCVFSGCSAYQGGGLYASEMRMLGNRKTGGYVDGCVFTNNAAINIGGAIYGSKLDSITNCRFVDNHAGTGTGGAFHLGTACNGVASNCTFIGNSSRGGGAVGKCDYIYDSVFTDNWTTNNGAKSSGGGGAIANSLGMFNCTFSNNVAYVVKDSNEGGGAAYNCNGTNCRFENNVSAFRGGAVFYSTGDVGAYTNCQFVGNISTNHGGAAYFGTYVNCEFNGNTCDKGGNGGACYQAKCYGCKIVNNKVLNARAGGVSSSTCFDCVFSNNYCSASARGGAAAWSNCTRCKFYGVGDVSVGCFADCEFDGILMNSANDNQSFVFDSLYNSGGCTYITNCLIHNCEVAQIFHCDGRTMEAVNCTIVNNKLKNSGGLNALVAVCNRGVEYTSPYRYHVSTNRLINCLFANNTANGARMDLSVWTTTDATYEGVLCMSELYNCMYESGTSFTGGIVTNDCFQGKARFNKGSNKDQPYYALRYGSDAKNKGLNMPWMETSKDLAGKNRIIDGIVDIGCYECDMLPLGLGLMFQ